MKAFNKIKASLTEEEIIEVLGDLVSCPSHAGIVGQETQTAEKIASFFKREGIEVQLIPVCEGRSNVIAVLRGNGEGKTLLLTGHTDTVPVYDMPGDPYTIKIENGRIYGRGTVDMKGPLACMMTAMVAIKRSGTVLAGDLVFAGVIDEEDGSFGTIHLIGQNLKIDGAVVGEPTDMQVCTGHRGLEWLEFKFTGKAVHGGAQKEGVSAIEKAVKFINRTATLAENLEKRSHPLIGTSSMNYGKIVGGTQPSTVAGECFLQVDRRWIPGERYEEVLGEYQKILDELAAEDPKFIAEMKVMDLSMTQGGYVHEALETAMDEPIVKAAQNAVTYVTGKQREIGAFQAWSDGGLLSYYAKMPTIVLGPGNLESAHSATEHIEVKRLVPAALMYAALAMEFCEVREK